MISINVRIIENAYPGTDIVIIKRSDTNVIEVLHKPHMECAPYVTYRKKDE